MPRYLARRYRFGKLIVRIVRAERSHNESKQKSQRISKAWAQKKHHSAPGVSITNKLPGWLEGKTKEPMRINADKAKVVRQIFEWSAQGLGKRLIARRLNVQGVSTFGGGKRKADKWGQSYIQKLLFNRSVLGEFQPFKISGEKHVL
jgi:DNA invertase Pin-like site-specific DNA recombinase